MKNKGMSERIKEVLSNKFFLIFGMIPTSKQLETLAECIALELAMNECKYCGAWNQSLDPDILCPDCQDTFGHARYSEL